MAEFEFEEKNSFSGQNFNAYRNPRTGLANWLIKKGISKNEKQAYTVMTVIIIVSFVLSFIILKNPGNNSEMGPKNSASEANNISVELY
jgi:hypothetical protein